MATVSGFPAGTPGTLHALLAPVVGEDRAGFALATLAIDPALANTGQRASRAEVAMALNAALFLDLMDRVPTAARYVDEVRARGDTIVCDHGALRTIAGETGALPSGYEAFTRFLAPLGYEIGGLYPLPALRMTGRALVHRDMPEAVPQVFVSELHVDQLPEDAQAAAANVFGASADPIDAATWSLLEKLDAAGECSLEDGAGIVSGTLRAFARQHPAPALADYEALALHTKEGAWIATEGNAFNHATTRVPDVDALAKELAENGYPMKPKVEVSANGRVRQTAILADKVERPFRLTDGHETMRQVPGSFYEYITRDTVPETGMLDLTFDSGNATGIFAVTRDT